MARDHAARERPVIDGEEVAHHPVAPRIAAVSRWVASRRRWTPASGTGRGTGPACQGSAAVAAGVMLVGDVADCVPGDVPTSRQERLHQ